MIGIDSGILLRLFDRRELVAFGGCRPLDRRSPGPKERVSYTPWFLLNLLVF